ncbi:hypothetical protein JRO89_XS12G0030800 [Xanthoceras sorbifolium]|uniref:RING-CH-type domain-containing protein n=1 Tax=Xanthoceras sorbifolium TaxID=99658 RepID=A0ABQ8HAX5_9ROSI|nr:hypothetical protein JRO89_XS12G0030800 [Xanthoceras sorbifolium]
MANEEKPGLKENDEQDCSIFVDSSVRRVENSTEIVEVTPPGQLRRWQGIVLEIPPRTVEDAGEDLVRINMPKTSKNTPTKANFSSMPSPPRVDTADEAQDIEKAAIMALGSSSTETRARPRISRTLSLTKLFTSRMKTASSSPVTPISHSNLESMHGAETSDSVSSAEGGAQKPIHRSHSVPELTKDISIRQLDSLGVVFRVIRTTPPQVAEDTAMTTSNTSPPNDTDRNDGGGEDIPEEEAVCRICLIELGEGADTLKMECSCKGALALAHQECAVKWFSIKGNRRCDVCKQEVRNLPVTLLRLQNFQNVRETGAQQAGTTPYRQDVPILVIVSMLAYFCYLEQLLVSKMKSGTIAISLPFSCILGILASMTATNMVRKKYIWIYALIQFVLVVLSAHLFYSLIHMQAVLSVLLSTFVGFGMTMCGTSILGEVLKYRRQRLARSSQQLSPQEVTQPNQPSTTAHQNQTDSQHQGTEIRDSETTHGS